MKDTSALNQVPNTYLRQFFRYLSSRESLLENTSESPATLARLDGSNSFRDYCQFFRNAREQFERPDIGLELGRVNQLANMHGPVSTVVFQSLDIRDCMALMQRFTPLRLTILRVTPIEEDGHIGLQLELKESAGDIHTAVSETLLLSLAGIISAVSQGNVHPSRIDLDYPRPSYARRYQEAFETSSFRFSSPYQRVMVAKEDAEYRSGADADPALRASAIKRCEELLRGVMKSQSVSDEIRQIFADNPGHLWSIRDIASHLNTSDRTLQRRLAVENTSYQKLHNEWLKTEAHQLLLERNLTVESISLLLGYSDVSNFRQACRRWYGVSPFEYRKQLRLDVNALAQAV